MDLYSADTAKNNKIAKKKRLNESVNENKLWVVYIIRWYQIKKNVQSFSKVC